MQLEKTWFGNYKKESVEIVVDDLKKQITELKSELEQTQRTLSSYQEKQNQIGQTLIEAKQMATYIKEKAEKEAEELVSDAEFRKNQALMQLELEIEQERVKLQADFEKEEQLINDSLKEKSTEAKEKIQALIEEQEQLVQKNKQLKHSIQTGISELMGMVNSEAVKEPLYFEKVVGDYFEEEASEEKDKKKVQVVLPSEKTSTQTKSVLSIDDLES